VHKFIGTCIELGTWGFGEFRNPAEDIARICLDLLGPGSEFQGLFKEVLFLCWIAQGAEVQFAHLKC
jgi:hypothetical protein